MMLKVLKRITLYAGTAFVASFLGLYAYLLASADPGHFWRTANHMRVTVTGARLLKQVSIDDQTECF